jgi:ADP-ribose pyrophosphatase YjhB (NUDIX family)
MDIDYPKHLVVVLVFIRDDDKILLVRQGYGEEYWSLPGGAVEENEALEQAALREVKEETGLEIRIKRIVGIYSKIDESALAITFEGEVIGGILNPSHEVVECRFFPKNDLPMPTRHHLIGRIEDFLTARPEAVFRSD